MPLQIQRAKHYVGASTTNDLGLQETRGCCPNIVDGLTTKASRVVNLEVLELPGKYGFPETNMLA